MQMAGLRAQASKRGWLGRQASTWALSIRGWARAWATVRAVHRMARLDKDALSLTLGSLLPAPPPAPHPHHRHDSSGFCGQEPFFSRPDNKLTLGSPMQMRSSPVDCPSLCIGRHPLTTRRVNYGGLLQCLQAGWRLCDLLVWSGQG